jgi:acyl-CoA synthetase (AMP-forming)/AMP-acid ligase II
LLLRRAARRPPPSLPALLRVSVGSGPLSAPELRTLLTAVFPGARGYFTYGLTEAGPRVSTLDAGTAGTPAAALAGDGPLPIGAPLAGVTLAVRGGALAVRTPFAARAAADADGWLLTADDAREDAAGIMLLGRSDGAIGRGGATIYPEDVERVASAVPGVAASCCVGRPSALYGQVPVLAWELHAGADADATAAALAAALRDGLAPVQRPVEVWRVGALPRSALGKVRRAAVLAEVAA